MSTVILQIGQCGNQIGSELWDILKQDPANHDGLIFCSHDEKFRSVNVDSEPKVVRKLLHGCKSSNAYRNANVIAGRDGRGSNWAYGYHGSKLNVENSLLCQTMDSIRKEIERCPTYSGMICMHSLAGGTGSGLGSRLHEALRDEYPINYILSCVVSPYSLGENPLQYYNMLLSLATLQQHSDGILLFDNDEVLRQLQQCGRRHGYSDAGRGGDLSISLSQVNQHIASCIAGLILPAESLTGSSRVSIGIEPWEMVRSLCSMPTLKFMNANFMSRSKVSWHELTTSLLASLSTQSVDVGGSTFSSISNLLVARGCDAATSFPTVLQTMDQRVKTALHTVTWNPYPVDFWTAKLNPFRPADSVSLTLASNGSSIVPLLENTKARALQKFEAGAYLHWYERYGCQREDFEMAFSELDKIVASYREAVL